MKKLRLILGDQLNTNHSWFKEKNEDTWYCMFETRDEAAYVTHHIQKLVGFFLSMRSFKEELEAKGHQVIYYQLDHPDNKHNFHDNIQQLIASLSVEKFEYQVPDEYRLDIELKQLCDQLSITSSICSTEHFYTNRNELSKFFKGKKQQTMELFYRYMRKKHQVLLVKDQPLGGKWNLDHMNRNKWNDKDPYPKQLQFQNEFEHVYASIQELKINYMGTISAPYFEYPINRSQSLELLQFFLEHQLKYFGTFQDAMHDNEPYLFHSKLSFSLNLKMISPKEVIDASVAYYFNHQEDIALSQIEGFVRQILGWREYMRGMYWSQMPKYKTMNHLKHHRKLPKFFWDGETKMNCLKKSLNQSLDLAYAHHIQRLMVIGNFSLLAELDPDQIDQWYLGVYIDAIEWVQLPNTRGMSQFADGGLIATKPYISSLNYIHKMSNYCSNCHYNQKERISDNACPMNSLYWNFLIKNESKFESNFRMKMMYRQLDKLHSEEKIALMNKAESLLSSIEDL